MDNLKNVEPDIQTGRLRPQEYSENFSDLHPPLSAQEAKIESDRCYYCYDAPCLEACPTGINIPQFIGRIAQDNPLGAANTILSANIFGGTCARVCPVDTLCEGACVREKQEGKPVKIGLLQRYATDYFFEQQPASLPRAKSTNKKVVVVGSGPAGLTYAYHMSRLGYEVTILEAKPQAGGLNADGLAAYKIKQTFVEQEIDYILRGGGIHIEYNKQLGRDFHLSDLQKNYAAVFLAVGLSDANALNIPGENLSGVFDAIAYIAKLRGTKNLAELPVGKHVVVIGGGNTAVDIASQIKRLGATTVAMLYRGEPQDLKATAHEIEVVQLDGVLLRTNVIVTQLLGNAKDQLVAIECEETCKLNGKLIGTGKRFTIPADMLFKAIGQKLLIDCLDQTSRAALQFQQGKIVVDKCRATSISGVYAGGDCIFGGKDLTVTAVEDGKRAAQSCHQYLLGLPA
jgi:glutamate synthase (NADPH/NADH) small chain